MSAPTVTTPLSDVMDAAATYAAGAPGVAARQVCVDQIEAALARGGAVNVPYLVFDLAFMLALRDQI
jgi:hypothetical protein